MSSNNEVIGLGKTGHFSSACDAFEGADEMTCRSRSGETVALALEEVRCFHAPLDGVWRVVVDTMHDHHLEGAPFGVGL